MRGQRFRDSLFDYSFPPILYSLFSIFFLPALTALLLILSYPKFNLSFLAFFAFAPLTIAFWKSKDLKQALMCGIISGFIFYSGILYWVYWTLRAAHVQHVFSILAWILLSSVLLVEWIIFALFGFYFKKAGRATYPFVMASAWVVIEYLKIVISEKLAWFPWFMLGYTQWDNPQIIQIVSVTGIYGLSFVLVFCGVSLGMLFLYKDSLLLRNFDNHPLPWLALSGAEGWEMVRGILWKKILRIFPAFALVLFILVFGIFEIKESKNFPIKTNINFSILQPNIDWYKKWDEKYEKWIKTRIEKLIYHLTGGQPDVVIWPENALPGWIDEPALKKWLEGLVKKSGKFHIVGSVSLGEGKHVSCFLMDSSGEILDTYNKRKLVPFGEYVPLRNILGKYIKVIGELGEFEQGGKNQKLFEIDTGMDPVKSGFAGSPPMLGLLHRVKIANFICYESIFPYLFYSDAQKDADLFVNITNDGWYLDTAAPYQHFIVNIFRAVENRRPLVRAANTGISSLIDPWGRVLVKTNLNEYRILNAKVPIYNNIQTTFYSKHKNWFAIICLIIVSAFFVAVLVL